MNARRASATAAGLLLGMALATAALAQNQGGILRVQHRDSPASMSILEEGSISAIMPMMGVFNNLVLFISTWRKTASKRSFRTLRRTGPRTRKGQS